VRSCCRAYRRPRAASVAGCDGLERVQGRSSHTVRAQPRGLLMFVCVVHDEMTEIQFRCLKYVKSQSTELFKSDTCCVVCCAFGVYVLLG
jgi:hypothetical protein